MNGSASLKYKASNAKCYYQPESEMTDINASRLVTVFGGSGFVGRYVVRALARRGYRVRVAVRRPDLAGHLQPLGDVGQIQLVQANLRYRNSVASACKGADVVINLVGILSENGKQKFDIVQAEGAKVVALEAFDAKAKLIHVSSLSAEKESPSLYAQSKAQGEAAVREILPDAIIMRPSIVFGPEDDFFNRFAAITLFTPVLPAIGGGKNLLQPVYVMDVAEAIAKAVDGDARPGTVYELGGPDVITFREAYEVMLDAINRKRFIITMPWWMARIAGSVLGLMPKPFLTLDQVKLLQNDNVVSPEAGTQKRDLQSLGIQPTNMKAILSSYLVRFKPHGQYGDKRAV